MLVPKVKFAPIAVVAVHNPNDRATTVGQQKEQLLFDRLKLAAADFVSARVAVEGRK